jgi:hypothetical protein
MTRLRHGALGKGWQGYAQWRPATPGGIAWSACRYCMRHTPPWQLKCLQQSELKLHRAPVPLQQTVGPIEPVGSAQMLFVVFGQQSSLMTHREPKRSGRHCNWRSCCRHWRHRRRLPFPPPPRLLPPCRLAASDSPPSVARPTAATVEAATTPSAARTIDRRVLALPTCRVNASNRDSSTTFSLSGDAPAAGALPIRSRRQRHSRRCRMG